MTNPFLLPPEEYQRDLNLRQGIVEQIAKYTSLREGIPYEEVVPLVIEELNSGKLRLRDRSFKYLQRKEAGERVEEETTFLKYIDLAIDEGRILSPSMTIYRTAEEDKSVTAEWLDGNIAMRRKSKTNMFVLKQNGDLLGSLLADYDQNARKIRINSVSGMRGFKGCPLFIQTGHSSLTTLCRAAAGYGNGVVERFLGGARHYHTAEVAKANLVAVLMSEKREPWQAVMDKYQLKYPTVDDVMSMVDRSSSPYWKSEEDVETIRKIVTAMEPIERAIVLFSGDMYHLAITNEDFTSKFIDEFLMLEELHDEVDTKAVLSTLDTTEKAYVYALCEKILKGTTLQNVERDNPEGYKQIGRTAKRLKEVLVKYADFIGVIFTTKHLPPTVGNIRDINRTTGIIADTDSTIFMCQWWVEKLTGHIRRGYKEDRIWYFTTYAVCQCIANALALLSANVGVERKFINRLSMKNEYGFPVLMNTNLSKTYAALVSIREGNVFEKNDLDLKGVGLRGSSAPPVILKGLANFIEMILNNINEGVEMNAADIIKVVADYELRVIRSVLKGEPDFLRTDTIKQDGPKEIYHHLWQDVFSAKYGSVSEPPYTSVKLSLELGNKTAVKEFLESIKDVEIRHKFDDWLVKFKRDKLELLHLPVLAIKQSGLPEELVDIANVRKIAYDTCSGFYLVLEACGLFIVDRDFQRLAYEFLELEV